MSKAVLYIIEKVFPFGFCLFVLLFLRGCGFKRGGGVIFAVVLVVVIVVVGVVVVYLFFVFGVVDCCLGEKGVGGI